jgi:hypothetical protein
MRYPAQAAALLYLERGYSFYPAMPGSKTPAFDLLPKAKAPDGIWRPTWRIYRDRQPTKGEIRHWFRRDPAPNIVWVCGVGGLTIFDLDSAAAIEMVRAIGLPDAPTVASRRGEHVYFNYSGPQLKYDFMDEAELLGEGRCCTAPPSVHETGHRYAWLRPLSEVPALPTWVIKAAQKPLPRPQPVPQQREKGEPYAMAALRNECNKLRNCGGRRNSATRTCAYTLRRWVPVLGFDRIASEIEQAAVATGLSESEARPVIRRGLTA